MSLTINDLAWDKDGQTFMAPNTILRWWYDTELKSQQYAYRKRGECGRGIYSRHDSRQCVNMTRDVTVTIGDEKCYEVLGGLAYDFLEFVCDNNWDEFYRQLFN